LSAPREIFAVMSPDEVQLVLAGYLLSRRQIEYNGPADIQLITMTDARTGKPVQYRLSIKLIKPVSS